MPLVTQQHNCSYISVHNCTRLYTSVHCMTEVSCVLCHTVLCCAELAIGNIVRRVLHMIREEQEQEQLGVSEGGTAAEDTEDQQQVGAGRLVTPHTFAGCGDVSVHLYSPTALHIA